MTARSSFACLLQEAHRRHTYCRVPSIAATSPPSPRPPPRTSAPWLTPRKPETANIPMQKVLSRDLWKSIRVLARKSRQRKAAIAYVTRDLVGFHKGDVLVVNDS